MTRRMKNDWKPTDQLLTTIVATLLRPTGPGPLRERALDALALVHYLSGMRSTFGTSRAIDALTAWKEIVEASGGGFAATGANLEGRRLSLCVLRPLPLYVGAILWSMGWVDPVARQPLTFEPPLARPANGTRGTRPARLSKDARIALAVFSGRLTAPRTFGPTRGALNELNRRGYVCGDGRTTGGTHVTPMGLVRALRMTSRGLDEATGGEPLRPVWHCGGAKLSSAVTGGPGIRAAEHVLRQRRDALGGHTAALTRAEWLKAFNRGAATPPPLSGMVASEKMAGTTRELASFDSWDKDPVIPGLRAAAQSGVAAVAEMRAEGFVTITPIAAEPAEVIVAADSARCRKLEKVVESLLYVVDGMQSIHRTVPASLRNMVVGAARDLLNDNETAAPAALEVK